MNEKRLSVIVPMYNAQKYIRQCLDSLLLPKEQIKYLEVIIVDDGSTDRGAEYAKEYVKKYPESFFLLQKRNGGHGSAVNQGVRLCRGRYFKVLDADDWMDNAGLQEVIGLLDAIDAQAIACGYDRYDMQSKETSHICAPPALFRAGRNKPDFTKETRYLDMRQLIREWNSLRQLFCLHGLIYQTKFYRSLPYELPEQVSYDDAFFFTVPCSHADKLCLLDKQLYVYRVGDTKQSVSAKNREQRISQSETVIRAIMETKNANALKTGAGREYWYRKLVSVVTDYYVTAFLRCRDRKHGRQLGEKFMQEIGQKDAELCRRIKSRYWLLRGMGRCHRSGADFETIVTAAAALRRFL